MARALSRCATIIGVSGLLLLPLAAPVVVAQATEVAEDILMEDEAWFYRLRQPLADAPDPEDPTGAQAPAIGRATVRDQTDVYGRFEVEALHVGIKAGEPEARTMLSFPLFELGEGLPARILGGTVTLTDAGSSFGSHNAENAEMVACLVTEFFVAAVGADWEDQAEFDCATSSPLVLEEGSDPLTWTVDLAPFASVWANPDQNFGIAIVEDPDSETPAPAQTWHAAFHNKLYEPEEGEEHLPIRATLRYEREEIPSFDPPSFDPPAGGTSGGPRVGAGSGFGGAGTGPSFGGQDSVPPDDSLDEQPAPEVGAPLPGTPRDQPLAAPTNDVGSTGGRVIPGTFLLPFLALGLAGLLGYSLNQDPQLPVARQGAVSRLMQRRAGPAG